MPLSDYIAKHSDPVLSDWAAFARRHVPAARGLDDQALIRPAESILAAIGVSLGEIDALLDGVCTPPAAIAEAARAHAAQRLGQRFTLEQMIAEYRLLRVSIVRGWSRETRLEQNEAIDELTRFEAAVDHTSAEAIKWFYQRVERGRDLLVAVLAHDVRTPLGAIMASADFLLGTGMLAGQTLDAARQIRNSATRLRLLANDLLDFARTRFGSALPLALEPLDLGDLCRRTVNELEILHPAASLELRCSGDLHGFWDGARLEQMLSNLTANAIEHGVSQAPIRVTARARSGTEVVLKVQNTGPPIPETVRQVMLDPLKHLPLLEPQRDYPTRGLGLGLFIARLITEAHGGHMEFSSRENLTTVTIRLPRRAPEQR
jgi:signal transduction histidine kinase